jgi:hypothetical protein
MASGRKAVRTMVCRSRLGAVLVLAVGALTLACGGEDPDPPAPLDETPSQPEASDEPVVLDREWGLDFEISGRGAPMTARAELQITEGEPDVHVQITGRTPGTDVMIIELTFQGFDAVLGPHREQLGLPEGGPHAANGSLDDIWYYSQSGEIEFSLSEQGVIEGRFDIALAQGEVTPPGVPVVFQADEVTTPLVGTFSGPWVLSCHSRLRGHGTLIPGGDYCESLAIAE